ncbi:beta-ketoacyl-ACP synthase III [Synechococcus sp. CC9616]|uniref:beta-ketoacyl-ACP synthase III n=1 Tax=Synechococcus sp. CC9616 TaxID=110663 RepID=UPI00048BC375|nr:beta-ketoacyl-ACP synthase III [Synechococcus sp. CC9616]
MVAQPFRSAGVLLRGCGSATPSRSISNADLGQRVETSDSWIRSRTGIAARRVLGPSESLIDLCAASASSALTMAGWEPDSLDLILLATSTPDDLFGSAPRLQSRLGAHRAVAFDLTAACSGFLFALITAAQYLRSGAMRRILVVGADQLSRWVDWDDRRSCVLFGDAAGALVMEASPDDRDDLNGFLMRSDGSRGDVLKLPQIDERAPLVGDASHPQGGFQPIQMNGQEVYKFAVREVPGILDELLQQADLGAEQLDWLLLHQANQRILDAVAERFAVPSTKVLSNLANYGNTSAATIPLMLDEAVRDGRIQAGHRIASSGFGAGLSWGAALLRWSGPA